jgi:hypothetical protein
MEPPDVDEAQKQRRIHDAIEAAIGDDELLVGWIVIYETAPLKADDAAACGHFYGPKEMTTWRALGLVEWAKANTLALDRDDADE